MTFLLVATPCILEEHIIELRVIRGDRLREAWNGPIGMIVKWTVFDPANNCLEPPTIY